MIFHLPIKLYEEAFAVEHQKEEFKKLGSSALLVTGKNSAKKSGAYEDVTAALDSLDIHYDTFDQVEENPSTDTILLAVDSFKNKSIDFVIGIGGGSPMDAAKAIALLLAHPNQGLNYLYDASMSSQSLPVVCIPTTCGTGSEATGVSVLTRKDKASKGSIPHRIYPTLSLVDYRYLMALPDRVLKSSAIDALCHAIESYINVKASDYSNLFAFEAISLLGQALPKLLTNDATLSKELFANLMHASTLAGMAIAHTGTSLPHALSYRLTYNDGIAHGTACAYFLSDFVEHAPTEYQEQLTKLLGLANITNLRQLIEALCDFSAINPSTVALSATEITNTPAKLKTAPFTYALTTLYN